MAKSGTTMLEAEAGRQELVVSREFDAPRELVFRAYSEPELYVQWYGCSDMRTRAERFEAKSGGSYRLVQSFKGSGDVGSHGVFHEVAAPERLVRTVEGENLPGHVWLETVRFEALAGSRSRVVLQMVFQSVADRDMMVRAGVEKGTREAFQNLDALLSRLKE